MFEFLITLFNLQYKKLPVDRYFGHSSYFKVVNIHWNNILILIDLFGSYEYISLDLCFVSNLLNYTVSSYASNKTFTLFFFLNV